MRPTAPCPGRPLAPPCGSVLEHKGQRFLINNRQNRRRGRGGQRGPQGGRNDNRNRGNASQLLEKYKGLARDAEMSGDRVQKEYYLQFADHYFRVLEEIRVEQEKRQDKQSDKPQGQQKSRKRDDRDDDDGDRVPEVDNVDTPPKEARKPRRKKSDGDDSGADEKPQRKPRQRRKKDEDGDNEGGGISADALPPAISADDEAA